jgi:hypothetical protein
MVTSSLLVRYRNGGRESVWTDLMALGGQVRDSPLFEDARDVARETMERAKSNVDLLVERLQLLGYRFAAPEEVWSPPTEDSLALLDAMEERFGPFPLSVRAWHEVVGAVDFRGAHPKLASYNEFDWGGSDRFWCLHWYSDPLVVDALDPDDSVVELWDEEATEDHSGARFELHIAPDAIHKSNISGGEHMAVQLPDPAADCSLLGSDWAGVPFVSYLREAFRWGGFPGLGHAFPWSDTPPHPEEAREELALLTADLLPL